MISLCSVSKGYAEKATAPHSSIFAWRIPWTEEPGRLPSMGSHRAGHDSRDLAAAEAAMGYVILLKVVPYFLPVSKLQRRL